MSARPRLKPSQAYDRKICNYASNGRARRFANSSAVVRHTRTVHLFCTRICDKPRALDPGLARKRSFFPVLTHRHIRTFSCGIYYASSTARQLAGRKTVDESTALSARGHDGRLGRADIGVHRGILLTRSGFDQWQWSALPQVATLLVPNLVGGPLGEEPGWRGYALPRLQRPRSCACCWPDYRRRCQAASPPLGEKYGLTRSSRLTKPT